MGSRGRLKGAGKREQPRRWELEKWPERGISDKYMLVNSQETAHWEWPGTIWCPWWPTSRTVIVSSIMWAETYLCPHQCLTMSKRNEGNNSATIWMSLVDASLQCSKDSSNTNEYSKRGGVGQGRIKEESFSIHTWKVWGHQPCLLGGVSYINESVTQIRCSRHTF